MSLLLLAGLAQVDSALDEAAKVDGATFWQRLYKVTLPNMKAAIMVALLFRTLDAFRIFDNVFIMTGGSQNTSTVSLVAYNQTISRAEIGMGSAVSVLLFLHGGGDLRGLREVVEPVLRPGQGGLRWNPTSRREPRRGSGISARSRSSSTRSSRSCGCSRCH